MTMRMSKGGKIALYAFLILIVIITVVPLLYTVSASLKTNFEIAQGGINLIPKEPTFDNFKTVWGMGSGGTASEFTYADYTVNSLKVSILTVIFVVIFTSMSAYCFERGNFPGRKFLYWLFMTTMFIGAGTITIFPMLQITSKLKMNNLLGLAIVQFATAGASNLFLTMGYLKTISHDLDDAAKIDGCSFFSTWWRIILPLSRPILATVALMSFRASWNNYLLPNLMLSNDKSAMTLVVAVVKLQSSGGAGASQYNLMMAGTMLALMPMLILFLCMNKMFVEGITQGAVKG